MADTFLAFDIETCGIPFDQFDDTRQEYLLRNATDEAEREKKIAEMALSPLTGFISCIGMYRVVVESGIVDARAVAYSYRPDMDDNGEYESVTLDTGDIVHYSGESTLLSNFWRILAADRNMHLISFNGRGFDCPFLMLRSAVLGVKPSRNLMAGTRFNYPLHTDLLDKLTFFMPSQTGATRRFNFDFFTKAFGIESPKSQGVDGSKVGEFFRQGKHAEIASYCLRDVKATWELFRRWQQYLDVT